MKNRVLEFLVISIAIIILSSCESIDVYKKPDVEIPKSYSAPLKLEFSNVEWKVSNPSAEISNKKWWESYEDPQLNELQQLLTSKNLDIVSAEALYRQSIFLVDKARASYFPTIILTSSLLRKRQPATSSISSKSSVYTRSFGIDTSWELDLWNSFSYNVSAVTANADSLQAQLNLTILSSQTSLAQYYNEYCTVTEDQDILDEIYYINIKLFEYIRNRYNAGIADQFQLDLADTNMRTAEINSLNNQSNIDLYKNAILTLINSPTDIISPKKCNLSNKSINIPLELPSTLLERRPDIAYAERNVAIANAQMGIASSSFFPSLTLSASNIFSGTGLSHFLSLSTYIWSVGPQIAFTLFEEGTQVAEFKASQEQYNSTIALYKKTVLSAFYDVENNLSLLKYLKNQITIFDDIVEKTAKTLVIVNNQYKQRIVDYSSLLNVQSNYLTAKKNALDAKGLRISAEIGLIKALGGTWDEKRENDSSDKF